MNNEKSGRRFWRTGLMAVLVLLLLPMGIWAEVDGKMATTVSIASSPSSVTFNTNADELDKAVYKAMNIVVVDGDSNKIAFTADDISLDYNRQVGTQKITVTYKGNDQYETSNATGTIVINDVPKKDTRLVLKANPPAVGYSADTATLDKAVYDDLVIQVVDGDSNKVNFSPSDITLTYNHAVGTQNVVVAYKGNSQYNPSQVNATVQITGKQDSKVSVAAKPPAVAYTSDSAKLDLAVYQALSIVVVDAGNNKISFTAADIDLSYNRAPGKQDVTVKYKGNDQFSPSTATGNVEITGKVDPPAPTKENTSINLAKPPIEAAYTTDSGKLDATVYQALTIQVVDSKGKAINFTTTDIELSYNRVPGEQPVTVKYKGTDQFNSSTATQTVTITSKDDSSLIVSQNPPSVEYDDNTKNLDDAVYQDLCVAVVDDNNNKIEFNRDDIELDYTRAVGEQEVIVKYKGNNYFKSAVATVRVNIVQPDSPNPWLIAGVAGIIGAIVVVLVIIGVVVYRKKHSAS
ncbi:Bacterial Ig-like domain [anaerobic digester metagenome]|uniref:hypothetical protein n=1 Tax=Acetobacterium wieringae TaxID=52694 RepID=UPI0020335320|nr:hypothetical protein [Acetobacterium wieringae]URN84727.1 hypothetical protein CHL1_000307 [Acetobacterium wieringae]